MYSLLGRRNKDGEPLCACSVAQSYSTSCNPWIVAHQAPLPMGFFRQEYWSGLPFLPPREIPDTGIEPVSPTLAGGFFTTEPQGKDGKDTA